MTITPVTPRHLEQLVPTTTGILFDTTEAIVSVTVNGVVVWSGGSPQNSWLGFTLTHPAGTRYVFDAPVPWPVGQAVEVIVVGAVTSLTYRFAIGLRRITTTDDASSPRITEGGPPVPTLLTPLWVLPFDDLAGPPVDTTSNYTPVQLGTPTYQQPGQLGQAVALGGGTAGIAVAAPDVMVTLPAGTERTLTVTNSSGASLPSASVNVIINTAALVTAGKMDANGGARFYDSAYREIPYYLESGANTTTTSYWFKVDLLPGANTVYMRFAPGQNFISFQDKQNVFLFFDDFDGPAPLAQWTTVQGAPVYSGGLLTLNPSADGLFAANYTVPDNVIIETLGDPLSTTRNGPAVRIATTQALGFVFDGGAGVEDWLWWPGPTLFSESGSGETGVGAYATGLKKYKMLHRPGGADSVQFDYNNGQLTSTRTGTFTNAHPVMFNGLQGPVQWDWIRIYRNTAGVATAQSSDVTVSSSVIAVPPTVDPLKSQSFVISGWFNASTVGAQRVLASCGRGTNRGWVLRILATNRIEFRLFDGVSSNVVTSTTFVTAGSFFHVVGVFDLPTNTLRLYVNSNRESETTATILAVLYTATGGTTNDDLLLGQDSTDAPSAFQGRLDQWKYFVNQLPTDAQVAVLYQEGVGAVRTPWVGYSRSPGNIYVRKDEPLTSEVLLVPGTKVDLGYNEITNEIEILYEVNGKIFIVTGQSSENPSTLTQPNVLRNSMKTGGVGSGIAQTFTKADFPPLKLAVPPDSLTTGSVGSGVNPAFAPTPFNLSVAPLNGTAPLQLLIPSAFNTLIVFYELWKINAGTLVYLDTFAYSTELIAFIDQTFVRGEAYAIRAIYKDPGAPGMRRFSPFSAFVFPPLAGGGDFYTTGSVGGGIAQTFSSANFPPLKLAVPTDPETTGSVGSGVDDGYVRNWYAPTGATASMSASFGGYIVVTGLTSMGRQHLYLNLVLSNPTGTGNAGSFKIVEILSTTSVRIEAPGAAGSAGNNGAISWSIGTPTIPDHVRFTAINTLNIGVG